MDTGLGRFAQVSKNVAQQYNAQCPQEMSRMFRVGEILEIRGSKFRIEKIKTRSLRLLLLPDDENLIAGRRGG